jgi:hypothetical protein
MNENGYKTHHFCYYCKRYNPDPGKSTLTDKQGCKYWPRRYIHNKTQQEETSPIAALRGLISPLRQSQLVIPQLILNLCAVSIST